MARLNVFEPYLLNYSASVGTYGVGVGGRNLRIYQAYVPGSLSFNNLIMAISASGTTAKTLSIMFGLYSLNGSTLSLANSGSVSTNPAANTFAWITLATSATQDITPGNWFFGFLTSSSSNSRLSILMARGYSGANELLAYGGPYFRGGIATTATNLPASIATSDLAKEFNEDASGNYSTLPYVLISA